VFGDKNASILFTELFSPFLGDALVQDPDRFVDFVLLNDQGRGKFEGVAHGLDDQSFRLGPSDNIVHPVHREEGFRLLVGGQIDGRPETRATFSLYLPVAGKSRKGL